MQIQQKLDSHRRCALASNYQAEARRLEWLLCGSTKATLQPPTLEAMMANRTMPKKASELSVAEPPNEMKGKQ